MVTNRRFSAAALLLLAAAICAPLQAEVLTTTGPGPTLNIGEAGTIPTTQVAAGPFSDSWFFNLGSQSSVGGAVANIAFEIAPALGYNIVGLGVELFDGASVSQGGGAGTASFTIPSLPFGSYRLAVTGNATGTLGGIYSGAVAATAPVPLPAALPLLLGGLGALAAASRRRRMTAGIAAA